MAKICVVHRNQTRERMSADHADRRAALKAIIIDETKSFEDRMAARDKLNAMPRDGSKVRVRTRCDLTGRGRGVYRKFKLCRNKFREMASQGELPGVTKSSW